VSEQLIWSRDGADWPHREASEFLSAGGLRWHVQRMGRGPLVLLIHGTGSSSASWAGLAPLLARHCSVVTMDLPGHAFSASLPPQLTTLDGIAGALADLVEGMGLEVRSVVGHSAGAAIALRMVQAGRIRPERVFSLNGALLPFEGLPGLVFPPAARLIASNGLAARVFAWHAQDARAVRRLIASTGSKLDKVGVELYARLVRDVRHTQGTLAMMARWDLRPLVHALPQLTTPVHLLAGEGDRAVPPEQSRRVLALLRSSPASERLLLPGLGHLAHEERPDLLAELLLNRLSFPDRSP
jgi:magnesium chelatase accessory protein